MSRPFEAQFPGVCDACGERILPGQMAVYTDAGLVHDGDCPRPYPSTRRSGLVCPFCWMERSLDGSCLCEEDR